MKDTSVKESASEDKTTEPTQAADMPTETKREMRTKSEEEVEDSTDKILNTITAGVGNLNIKVDNKDDENKLNIKTDDDEDQDWIDSEVFLKRGPHGGRSVDHMIPSNILPKNVPMPVMMPDGQYYQSQPQQQMSCQRNGNRRTFDDTEEYGQPQKYTRPIQPYFEPSQLQQPPTNFNFIDNLSQQPLQNNLSDMNKFQQQPQPMPSTLYQQNGLFPNMSYPMETTTMKITNATSGGKVTVQTPVSPTTSIVDDFLRECDMNAGFTPPPQQYTNLPNITSPSPNSQIDYNQENFSEYRRKSQDTDSGLESEGVGSPWSDQAPSPNCMYNPPSVDSGCGRSPIHESQALPGMSPPKYPGAPSPASYRATPSPAGTSGYGSPGQPQLEDEFFSQDKQEELDLVLQVCNEDMAKKHKQVQRQLPTSIQQQPFMAPGPNFIPQTIQQAPVQGMAPVHMQPQPVIASSSFQGQNVVPVSSAPSIIILQQPQQPMTMPQQLLILPMNSKATPPPKRQGPRKILPKIAMQPNSGSNSSTSGLSTSANQTCKPGVTMATKTAPATNRNITQQANTPDKTQQNKLLMIARRTVANIPREDLRKSDDEGDTYLHIAVCKTDKYMVQALLERLHREGLDSLVDQENNKRQTPLYLAVFINQPVMVAMFIKFQANVNVLAQNLSSDGMTTEVKAAIHVAASQGKEYQRTLVELLRAKDISINIVNNYGQTALHCAIMAHGKAKRQSTERISSVEIIQTLLKAGADPSAQDKKSGKTPLMYAIEQKNHELVEAILKCVEPDKVKNVVKTQAFDGSSCIKIAEGLKGSFDVEIWNKLWNSLQSAANGSMSRYQFLAPVY